MDDNSIDLIPTDPPYGYSFMGKDWDKAVPSVETWKECYRVLKPGAFMFVMSAPRQDVLSHMIVNLDKAGFDTAFTSIYWAYASGFPKATNISKAIDRKLGVERDIVGYGQKGRNLTRNGNKGDMAIDELHQESIKPSITKPKSEQAKQLDGSYAGFQPKPAVEIIIVVMKPISEKSYTDQALSNGKGITWLDDCRVPTNPDVDDMKRVVNRKPRVGGDWKDGSGYKNENNIFTGVPEDGRFPANLLVSDDSLNDGMVYNGQQGAVTGNEESANKKGNTYGDYSGMGKPMEPRNDAGSFSRYYDVDAWWNERVSKLPQNVREVFPFLITPKAAKSEKNFGLNKKATKQSTGGGGGIGDYLDDVNSASGKYGSEKAPASNFHPTVKPIKLMSYLITLGSRDGDTIYDPYSGSATTLISAHLLGRKWIGSEMEKDYYEIGQGRLLPFIKQMSLF